MLYGEESFLLELNKNILTGGEDECLKTVD